VIPAGDFIFRDGQLRQLPEFNIDRYEVTLAEYSAFLDALPHGPVTRFDHPDQPENKSGHLPRDWPEVSAAARAAGSWKDHPITLNAPVFNIDWWDAWAYAKWKGRQLPTEEQWEKAARGPKGNLWPWGMDPDPKRANTGTDYADQPRAGGRTDGYAWWSDVDAMPGDASPYGVAGMGGNVAEWTSTLVPDPDLPDVQVPVFRGADFHQPLPVPLNASPWLAKSALYAQPFLGFRTASASSSH
jgi:formylglycine-generating enzyme required for sulfatase activity